MWLTGHMRTAFAPKLASAARMAAATRALPVRRVVQFSSTAALFGAPGQGNYAAANAALEAWAAAQAAQGHQAIAVQWGAWAAGTILACTGMSSGRIADERGCYRAGVAWNTHVPNSKTPMS